ncbi:MAG: thiamine phosphate synthase [Hyphomicrobiaceae bacterium]
MTVEETSGTQLMVALDAVEGAEERLAALLAAVPVSSVVVNVREGGRSGLGRLVESVQGRGAAVLIADDVQLARVVNADGVHLGYGETILESYETARAVLGGKAIIGADAGRSKHDAMTLGELGADYVAFGIPPFVKDRETAGQRQLELVAWWAEIFEVPSVAMDVADLAQAEALAAAGADFVCLQLEAGRAAADLVDEARSWIAALANAR